MFESLTPLKDSLETTERVTIYMGRWDRHQATTVRVFRAPYAQYADAFHVEFKPRGKRLERQFVDYDGSTIIVLGWKHPHVRPRILLPADEPTLAPDSNTMTVRSGGENQMDDIVDAYFRSLPLSDILLDLRGHVINGNRWSKTNT